jgi:hypothetical protein
MRSLLLAGPILVLVIVPPSRSVRTIPAFAELSLTCATEENPKFSRCCEDLVL